LILYTITIHLLNNILIDIFNVKKILYNIKINHNNKSKIGLLPLTNKIQQRTKNEAWKENKLGK
jgi:hypothetical protein